MLRRRGLGDPKHRDASADSSGTVEPATHAAADYIELRLAGGTMPLRRRYTAIWP